MQMKPLQTSVSQLKEWLANKYSELLSQFGSLHQTMDEAIDDWQREAAKELVNGYKHEHSDDRLKYWKSIAPEALCVDQINQLLSDYSIFCKSEKIHVDDHFWRQELLKKTQKADRKKSSDSSRQVPNDLPRVKVARTLLLDQWQKELDQSRAAWEVQKLARLRGKFIKEFEDFLNTIAQLTESLEALGLEPGIWLDLSKGALSPQQVEQFKRWANYLANDEGARAICELLGRMRQVELSERIETIRQKRSFATQIPDIDSKEEIIGVRTGHEIEHALPSELALLSDPDTAILFDLKFIESRLMCFDMQGMQNINQQHEVEVDVTTADEHSLGPMILCIDTSGSMHGTPETIAKAVALYMAGKAKEQKRPCYLINFSTGISTLEITGTEGMPVLIDFLSMSFHGGTDITPALQHALSVMKQESYENSDLLIVSDFIMADLTPEVSSEIGQQKETGNRFYSLVIGNCFLRERMETLFDHEWVYNPDSSKIHDLVNFRQKVVDQVPSPL